MQAQTLFWVLPDLQVRLLPREQVVHLLAIDLVQVSFTNRSPTPQSYCGPRGKMQHRPNEKGAEKNTQKHKKNAKMQNKHFEENTKMVKSEGKKTTNPGQSPLPLYTPHSPTPPGLIGSGLLGRRGVGRWGGGWGASWWDK